MIAQSWIPCGYQQITSLTAATALTVPTTGAAAASGSLVAVIVCEAQNVRWRDDGTAPSATVGMLMQTGDPPLEYSGDLAALQFIQATASAKLNVSYYRVPL